MRRTLALVLGVAAVGLASLQPTPEPPAVPGAPLVERPEGLTEYAFCPQWRSDDAVQTQVRAIPSAELSVRTRWWNGDSNSVRLKAERVGSVTSELRQGVVPLMVEGDSPFSLSMRAEGALGRSSSGCATWPAGSWAVGIGGSLEDETTTLLVMNPFPQTATVDISVYSEQGLEVVERLESFSIPAGESREIKLSDLLRLRTHLLVVVDDPDGLTFSGLMTQREGQLGAAVAQPLSEHWYFPAPPAGATAEVMVVNPSAVPVTIDIDHFGPGGSTLSAEQFTLERRSSIVLPLPDGVAVQVRSDSEVAAAMRAWSVSGLGIMGGVTSLSSTWELPGASLAEELIGLHVLNPGPTPTNASYRFVGSGGVSERTEFTVPAGASIYLEVRARGSQGMVVESAEPVAVTWATVGDEQDLILDAGIGR